MTVHPLRVERELRGWSQARVAEAIGTSTRTIIRWEAGQAVPYPYYRERLCALFGKNAQELGLLIEDEEELSSFLFDPSIPEALGRSNRLLGRNSILAQVKQHLLANYPPALTALQGLPGVGKTSLAVALSADVQVQARYNDGILWAGLGPQPNVLGHLARWGKLIGVARDEVGDTSDSHAWGRALRTATGSRRFLIVIDDAWQAEDALALQVGGSQCAHLLTTRLPQVAITSAPEAVVVVPELEEADGLDLLARFVPQLMQMKESCAHTLVQAVGGLPLALTLMGKYLASQAFTEQPRRFCFSSAVTSLQNTKQRLQVAMPIAPEERPLSLAPDIPLSLHAVIAVSARQLNKQAHTALCALAIFPHKPNSFSEEAALALCGVPAEVLDTLWDVGLLESNGPGRYTLHQTIADYARTHPESEIFRQRLVNYFVPYVRKHQKDYDLLEQEMSNILAAFDTASALALHQELVQGVIAFIPFMQVRGHSKLAYHYLKLALQAATAQQDNAAKARVFHRLGAFAEASGDYTQAEKYCQYGLNLARQLNLVDEVSASLTTLGLVAFQQGDYTQATNSLEEALCLARQLGESERICTLLMHLGKVMYKRGEYILAEALYQEGLTLARQHGHRELICLLLAYLGAAKMRQERYLLAERYAEEGLNLARRLGHRQSLIWLLNLSGVIVFKCGHNEQARMYCQEALLLARQSGQRTLICMLLGNLGELAVEHGDYAQGELYLREGIALAREIGNRNHLPLLLNNLSSVFGRRGEYEQAEVCLKESSELAHQLGLAWNRINVLEKKGELNLLRGEPDAAASCFHEMLALLNEGDSGSIHEMTALAQFGLAQAVAVQGSNANAIHLAQESLAELEALGHYKAQVVRKWLRTVPSPSSAQKPRRLR